MAKPPTETIPLHSADFILARKIADKDEAAFNTFVAQYRSLIFATAYNVLKNNHDSEDVVSVVLTKVWNKAHTYSGKKGSLKTWVCSMTRNSAIDLTRKWSRNQRLRNDYQSEKHISTEAGTCGMAPILQADTKQYLHTLLNRLPENQREVVELIFLKGHTQREAALLLNRPVGTVKAQMTRGIAKVRDMIGIN